MLSLSRGAGMSDAEILALINPPAAQRDREALIKRREMPEPDAWRLAVSIGAQLTGVVRSNHFKVDATNFPRVIYHYHVHMYKHKFGGEVSDEDCVAKEGRNI